MAPALNWYSPRIAGAFTSELVSRGNHCKKNGLHLKSGETIR